MYTLHRNSEHTARHDSEPMRSGLHVRRQSLNGSAACVVRQELCTGSLSRICSVLYVTYGAFTWEGVPTFSARGALGLPTEPGAYALSAVRTPAAGCVQQLYRIPTEQDLAYLQYVGTLPATGPVCLPSCRSAAFGATRAILSTTPRLVARSLH